MSRVRWVLPVTLTALVFAALTGMAHARISDGVGDYLGTYTGAKNGDMDVVSTNVSYDGTVFSFTSTMNGLVGTTPGAIYVFGINTGTGTAGFGSSLGLTNVLFDCVVILRPNTTVRVTRFGGVDATDFPAGMAIVTGNTISTTIPATELPTTGFDPSAYTFNFWPRLPGGASSVADFAPNTTNAAITIVPEAGSFALLAPALLGALGIIAVRHGKIA